MSGCVFCRHPLFDGGKCSECEVQEPAPSHEPSSQDWHHFSIERGPKEGDFTMEWHVNKAPSQEPVMAVGGKYNWKGQPERLVYLGKNWSGNGYWHQFAKVDSPQVVWCEVLDDDLASFEETATQAAPSQEPDDAELLRFAIEEQFLLFCSEEEVLDIMRLTLHKYRTTPPDAAAQIAQLQARIKELEAQSQEPVGEIRGIPGLEDGKEIEVWADLPVGTKLYRDLSVKNAAMSHIQVRLPNEEILRVTAEGEFIWHPDTHRLIEESDFSASPAMPHILRKLRKAEQLEVAARMALESCEQKLPLAGQKAIIDELNALREALGEK